MSHFAEINSENKVVKVIVGNNSHPDEGLSLIKNTLGGNWVKTSYNTKAEEHMLGGTPLRKNFAAVGYTYDVERDAFIAPKTYESWILDEDTCTWKPPVEYPNDNKNYKWDETSTSWVEAQEPTE
jgi:hypothetical protein